MSATASLELVYRSDAALLVAYATHLARGQLLLDTTEKLASGANVQLRLVAPSTSIDLASVVARPNGGGSAHPTEAGLTVTSRAETFGDAVDKLAFGFKGLKALVAASQAAPRALLIRYLRSIVTCEVIENRPAASGGAGGDLQRRPRRRRSRFDRCRRVRALRAPPRAPGGGDGAGAGGRPAGTGSGARGFARLR